MLLSHQRLRIFQMFVADLHYTDRVPYMRLYITQRRRLRQWEIGEGEMIALKINVCLLALVMMDDRYASGLRVPICQTTCQIRTSYYYNIIVYAHACVVRAQWSPQTNLLVRSPPKTFHSQIFFFIFYYWQSALFFF